MAQSPCLSGMRGFVRFHSGTQESVCSSTGDTGADTLNVKTPERRCLQTRQSLQELFAQQSRVRQLNRVVTGETCRTQPLTRLPRRLDHRVLAQVAQAVRTDAGADLLDLEACGNQLGTSGEVDAVKAGPLHRRAGDTHVNLSRSGLSQHP